jgi:hypothetical protein
VRPAGGGDAHSASWNPSAGGGFRTRRPLSRQGILSPPRLPFRHPGELNASARLARPPCGRLELLCLAPAFLTVGRAMTFPAAWLRSTATRAREPQLRQRLPQLLTERALVAAPPRAHRRAERLELRSPDTIVILGRGRRSRRCSAWKGSVLISTGLSRVSRRLCVLTYFGARTRVLFVNQMIVVNTLT